MTTQTQTPHTLAQDMVHRVAPTLLGDKPSKLSLHLMQDNLMGRMLTTLDMARLSMPAFAKRGYRLTLPYFYREAEFYLRTLASDYDMPRTERETFIAEQLSEMIPVLLGLYRWNGLLQPGEYHRLGNQLADRTDFVGQAVLHLTNHPN